MMVLSDVINGTILLLDFTLIPELYVCVCFVMPPEDETFPSKLIHLKTD